MPQRVDPNDFKTGFFEWRWLDFLWAAKDPIDDKRRWIIREAPGFGNQWELCYVQDTIPYRQCLDANPRHLAWLAVGKRIIQTTEMLNKHSNIVSDDKILRCQEFLETFSSKFTEGAKEDVASNIERNVDEEVRPANSGDHESR